MENLQIVGAILRDLRELVTRVEKLFDYYKKLTHLEIGLRQKINHRVMTTKL